MNKNIVIVVSSMNLGGAQRVVSILSNYWAEKGYQISIVKTYTGDKKDHYTLNKNINEKRLTNIPFFPSIKLLNNAWKFVTLRKVIKDLKPDIIFSFLTGTNVATSLATIGFKCPLIICERAWPPFWTINRYFFWILRIIIKKVKKVVVQTHDSKFWMNRNFPSSDVIVIPNPIDYPIRIDKQLSINPDSLITPDKKVIISAGRLNILKQFDLLIRSFSNIHNEYPEWNLVILGDGEEKENLVKLAFNLNINDKVFFPGSIGNISDWYVRADLFVLPTKMEGFPNVLLESMSYGLPCISFDCDTGPRDIIQDGINGILVNTEEKESGITNALIKLIRDDKLRKNFAQESILIREKYSIKSIMQIWDKILRS